MSIFENSILVNKKTSIGNVIGRIACIVCLAVFLLLTFSPIAPGMFLLPAVLVGFIFYLLHMEAQTEYEYTYIEGQLSFAKIKAKRKRKELGNIDMETVLMIAPENAPELRAYHNDQQVKVRNYTSGNADAKIYEVAYKKGEGVVIIRFEPDQNMLEMIQARNMHKVIIGK